MCVPAIAKKRFTVVEVHKGCGKRQSSVSLVSRQMVSQPQNK